MKKLLFIAVAIMIGASAFAQGYNSKGGSHRGYNTHILKKSIDRVLGRALV